jgi:hypothetical protein
LRTLTPYEVVVEMLRSYNEVCGPGERGEGSDVSDDRLLMMNPLWSLGSYAELYRCMYLMRERERHLYWNVAERYLRVRRRRTVGCPECGQETREGIRHVHHVANLGNIRFERGPIVQELWHPGVDEDKVQNGVGWIVKEHRGPPFLPLELYRLRAA